MHTLKPQKAGVALESYWTQAQTSCSSTQISLKTYTSHMKTRQTALPILTFEETYASCGGKNFTHPILLEVGQNEDRFQISCEIASVGKDDLIIPFGWWQNEQPLSNIQNPSQWEFNDTMCQSHVEDKGVGDMF